MKIVACHLVVLVAAARSPNIVSTKQRRTRPSICNAIPVNGHAYLFGHHIRRQQGLLQHRDLVKYKHDSNFDRLEAQLGSVKEDDHRDAPSVRVRQLYANADTARF